MQLYHFYHSTLARRLFRSELGRFDLAVWLNVFGQSLVGVFIPIFLLQLDYTLAEVMRFYLLAMALNVPLNLVGRWLVQRIGAMRTIAVGLASQVLFFALLYGLTPNSWPMLFALALVAALADVCYWIAHLYFFIRVSPNDENVSQDTSMLEITRHIGGLFAPAIGAGILLLATQQTLIALSAIIIALSIVPILTIRGIADKPTSPPMPLRTFFTCWDDARDYVVRSLHSIHAAAEGIVWPLFIYFTFATIASVAAVPIILAVTTIIFTFFVGRIRKEYRTHAITIGALLTACMWTLRLLIDAPIFLYGSIFLIGFFSVLIAIPVDSNIFEAGERKDALGASTYRNTFGMFSRFVFFGIIVLLTEVFHLSFIIAAASMLGIVAVATIALPKDTRHA